MTVKKAFENLNKVVDGFPSVCTRYFEADSTDPLGDAKKDSLAVAALVAKIKRATIRLEKAAIDLQTAN